MYCPVGLGDGPAPTDDLPAVPPTAHPPPVLSLTPQPNPTRPHRPPPPALPSPSRRSPFCHHPSHSLPHSRFPTVAWCLRRCPEVGVEYVPNTCLSWFFFLRPDELTENVTPRKMPSPGSCQGPRPTVLQGKNLQGKARIFLLSEEGGIFQRVGLFWPASTRNCFPLLMHMSKLPPTQKKNSGAVCIIKGTPLHRPQGGIIIRAFFYPKSIFFVFPIKGGWA